MKRRDFLKTGAVAAGLAGSLKLFPALAANESGSQTPGDNRFADYLRRAQEDKFLPKPPVVADSSPADALKISPMPLAERVRRKIVPRRGFCSLSPTSGALLSGTGAVNIELDGDPFTEQIPFRHEMLFAPRRRPAEAPNIADILPQVRHMMLDGKIHEAAQLAYQKFHANPIQGGGMGGGGGGGFSMRLDFPKSTSVKNYLRTVDFESTEVKIHWTDERGEWIRQTFTSRPDNLVVQSLTAPKGQSVNVRITVAAGGGGGRGGRGGRAGAPPAGGPRGRRDADRHL